MVKINKTTSKVFRELIFCEEPFHLSEKSEGKAQTKCITRPNKSFADMLMSQSELTKQLGAAAGDKRGKHRANWDHDGSRFYQSYSWAY